MAETTRLLHPLSPRLGADRGVVADPRRPRRRAVPPSLAVASPILTAGLDAKIKRPGRFPHSG